jgi:excisionase family DNA binding protein
MDSVITTLQAEDALMLSVSEAHSLMGEKKISRGAIYSAIRNGDLKACRVGRRILISRAYLLDFMNVAGK